MDTQTYISALSLAAHFHRNQTRKSDGTPYINHPIRVSNLIANVGGITDVKVLIGAILHDVVEDTDGTIEDIEKIDMEIAQYVREVSDNKSLPKCERKKLQIVHAANASYGAKLIKLADKLDNLSDLATNPPNGWSPDVIRGYFVWSKKVVDAMRGTNQPLENALDELFSKNLSTDLDLDVELENYYNLMKKMD